MAESVTRYGGKPAKKHRVHKQQFDLTEFTATLLCLLFVSRNDTISNRQKRKAKEFIDAIDIDEYRNDGDTYSKLILATILGKCVVDHNYDVYSAIKQKALEYDAFYDEFSLFFEDFENNNGYIIDGDLLDSELSSELVTFIDEYVSSRLQFYFLWKISNNLREIADTVDSGDLGNIDGFVEDSTLTIEEFLFAAKKSKAQNQYELSDFSTSDDSFDEAVTYASDLAKRPSNKIRTGISLLNTLLNGGYEGGRTYIYFAPSGGWKSGMLMSSALWAVDNIINPEYQTKDPTKTPCVLYLSGENDRNESIGRMVSFLEGSHEDLESTDTAELLKMLKHSLRNSSASFEFKFRPSRSINTNDIRNMIDDLALEGKEVVMLVGDYIKRFRPVETSDHRHLELGAIVDELSMIAKERMIPVISANQLNRETYAKLAIEIEKSNFDAIKKVNESNAGESINVIENADDVIFLNSVDLPDFDKRFLSFNRVKKRGKNSSKITFFHQPFDHDNNGDINGMRLITDSEKESSDIDGCLEIGSALGANYDPNSPAGSSKAKAQPSRNKRSSKAALIQDTMDSAPNASAIQPSSLVKKKAVIQTNTAPIVPPAQTGMNEQDKVNGLFSDD